MASAEVPPQEIYTAGERIFELQHAVSRLIEMQSEDITSPTARGVRKIPSTLTEKVLNVRLMNARVVVLLARERSSTLLYSFEDFSLDTARRELRRGGALIALQPQVFDLLEYAIRNRERVVSKDDLLGAVWNGRIVSESTLSTRINAARNAIGDSGEEQRLIRTAHGKDPLCRRGARGGRDSPQAGGDLRCRCRRLQPADGSGRGRHVAPADRLSRHSR
jgi:hypothetical protein